MTQPTEIDQTSALLARVHHAGGREIHDPATGAVIGRTVLHDSADLEGAIRRASEAQLSWAALPDSRRADYLNACADAIEAHSEELAALLSREQGKPLNGPNARFEVGACISWLRATAATQLDAEVLLDEPGFHAELSYKPIGVVAAISPWNWPLMISIWQIAPALRVGNAVVAKPSSNTPLCVQALIAVMNDVLPEGVLNVVVCDRTVGNQLVSHPTVGKVMFTGSTAAGQEIIRNSSQNLARLTLELGGNDAGIVLPGTDVTKYAEEIFWGAFSNAGQTCAALKRLYVHESQYEELVDALATIARSAPMGNGLDESNVLGPLQNKKQFDFVAALVDDARRGGARIVAGGRPAAELGPLFYEATIIADVSDGDGVVDQEQFGPVLPVLAYRDVDDAVASANALDFALGASVWSDDVDAARQVASRIQAGSVWINRHGGIHPMVPFGGIKASGYGVEFGVEGLKAVSVPTVVTW